MKEKLVQFFSLFTSTGTLICCALPALLATLAGGAAVSSLLTAFPWLIPLSKHKLWVFLIAGILILISGFITFRPQIKKACKMDGGETGCETAGKYQKFMLLLSLSIYLFGAYFTYGLVPTLRFFDQLGGST